MQSAKKISKRIAFLSLPLGFLTGALAQERTATSGPTFPNGYHCYHFSRKKPMELDVYRIAFFDENAPVAVGSSLLTGTGVSNAVSEPFALKNWALFQIPAGKRSAASIEQLSRDLAGKSQATFVSPVFVDNFGGPLLVTPEILVAFKAGMPSEKAQALIETEGNGEIVEKDWAHMPGAYKVRSKAKNGIDVLLAANALARMPEVRFAEPDMIFTGRTEWIPNDPGFTDCWGIHNTGQDGGTVDMDMDGPEAWDLTTGSTSIVAVVLDNGAQQDHPDLHQRSGTDVTSDPGDGGPFNACDNHGTAVASCISAYINNSLGTVGIAGGCRAASARTFISNVPCDGGWTSSTSWTVDALDWAETIGARVTNNSNGYGWTASAIEDKYASTRANGIVHFASAGNDSVSTIGYPSSLSTVCSIAALDRDGTRAGFSNWGVGLAYSAPGVDIYMCDRTGNDGYTVNDYCTKNGTSFSSPYTAGVAALMLSLDSSLTPGNVEDIIAATCVDLGTAGYDTDFGWGFVNAYDCVLASKTNYVWVDFYYSGTEDGSFLHPYDTLAEGVAAVPNGGKIMVKASSTSETLTIDKPGYSFMIESWHGSANVGY